MGGVILYDITSKRGSLTCPARYGVPKPDKRQHQVRAATDFRQHLAALPARRLDAWVSCSLSARMLLSGFRHFVSPLVQGA